MNLKPWGINTTRICLRCCFAIWLTQAAARGETVDLFERYPTKLTAGDAAGESARPWEFTAADVFRVSRFSLAVGEKLRVEVGPADLGIGHCADGAVWAVLIPREGGELTSAATSRPEAVSHVWLRFHPKEIARLFPPETVSAGGATNLVAQVRAIANAKIHSSWQAGGRAMIPEPKDMTVDVDTKGGPRRFFMVDTAAGTAEYVAAFANRSVRPPPVLTPELAQKAFDQLWEAFDQKYAMFVLRPELDWSKVREQYRPKALACKSAYELAGLFAEMLTPLRDLHVWLKVAGADVPVFNRIRTANANPRGCQSILRGAAQESGEDGEVAWAVTTNQIGYLAIYGWSMGGIPEKCGKALEKMRDTRGLILDVRLNGGGDEPTAEKVAGRFLEKEFVYAYSQFRNGDSHTKLTKKYPREASPKGPWRYNRPVVVLIGQKCMSSNESFIGMMTGDPQATTMGDHTCGSSGNPTIVRLPLDITVSVPQWIDYLPDGTPLDERGFQPQVPFKPSPGAFDGDRDDLLAAALARLSSAPLPEKAIEGPAFESATADLPDHSQAMKEEARDTSRPRVVSVTPTNGASVVGTLTELRVRFDRPMDPLSLKLTWEAGGFLDGDFAQYDTNKYEFTIPVRLAPGTVQQIVVNQPLGGMHNLAEQRKRFPREGFQSVDHRPAGLFVWWFRTQSTPAGARTAPPQVTAILPAPGSQVPYLTFLEIQFDQAMTPPGEASPVLEWERGAKEGRMISRIEYDAGKHAFRIPLLLPPKEKAEFRLTGFRSAAGAPARPISIQYHVTEEELSKAEQAKQEAAAREPRLLELLAAVKQKRAELTSLAERVQTLQLSQRDGLFTELSSQSASFRWQKPNCYYGDASEMMLTCPDFRIGSDGQTWWWHTDCGSSKELIICPAAQMHELNISICDPFGLTTRAPAAAASELGLKYAGVSKVGVAECVMTEAWQVDKRTGGAPYGSLIQWLIDRQTYRPMEIRQFHDGFVFRTRFFYDAVNEPLPVADFAPPKMEGVSPTPPEALDADYTTRFINLCDGSDGRVSLRWGKQGPKGRSSGGLN